MKYKGLLKYKFFLHPVFILIVTFIAIIVSTCLYVYWYIDITTGINFIIEKFKLDPSLILKTKTGIITLISSTLALVIIFGMSLTFFYLQKILGFYRLQHTFINNFTHELKTPLTSIKLYLETFLKHKIGKEEQEKYIHYMLKDVLRLSSNVNSILTLAQIESSSYTGKFDKADIVETIETFYENNRYLFEGKINIIKDEIQNEKIPQFSINLLLFEMLLMNITTNAFKYNTSKKPKLDIIFKLKKNKAYVLFKDNGIGIDKRHVNNIFDKFYQLSKDKEGSGLGLYFVKNIVNIHKIKINVAKNKDEAGTTFTLIFNVPKRN